MIAGFLKRLILLSFLSTLFLGWDSYMLVKSIVVPMISEEGGNKTLMEGYTWFFQNLQKKAGTKFVSGLKWYDVFEDDQGSFLEVGAEDTADVFKENNAYWVYVDASGTPVSEKQTKKIQGIEGSWGFVLLYGSIFYRFYILHIFLGVLLLGFFKDVFARFRTKGSNPEKIRKQREKDAQKLSHQVESLISRGKHQKVIELLESSQTKELLSRDLDRFDKALGRAYISLGNVQKGLPLYRKYLLKYKDDEEIKRLLGEYLSANPQDIRIQDLPALVYYVQENENPEIMKHVANLAVKNKVKDRATIAALIRICATHLGTPQIREYVLSSMTDSASMSDLAEEFYDACKKAEPENPKPILLLAESKMARGAFEDALVELESLINLDYENQRVHDLLFNAYQIRGQLDVLYQIYSNILEQMSSEPIALAQQRKIQGDPSFNKELADANKNMSLAELLAKRKEGDSSADTNIMKKYERTITIMFTDIKGYTSMTESQSIVETMAILQESDEILPPIITRHEGVVIKKIGDAFMARFDSADSAVTAGIQIQQAIWKNNKRREAEGKIRWEIRIGLNTGQVIVKDGDVYGDAVNIAARVESNSEANRVFCTEDTVKAIANQKLKFEAKDVRKMKGKAEGIQLYSTIFDLEAES